ncbi:MAG: DUF1566 domain-containing protein [Desulfobacteraceae bacterium]|nr:DUF1566 domain-containing protein [Desulfobacteraceae bacterium]MBC2756223.1 DUF1566 domain-containing protein [Desulfobacteraceae bacterium]
MQRENYYIILELSVDPPENDHKVIEKTIQNKKVEWSRLRNHPTKGLQVQKFVNMIPDIQKVMLDETLRKKEAQAASELMEAGKENIISEIDGHIDILMGKGYITKEDIIRLAKIHGLSQTEITDRITEKKNTKYSRIDQLISLRMGKGYITEDEVVKIAKKNTMDPKEIRNRIRGPIVKDEKEADSLKIQPVDKSIEKTINDNLKIIVKTSLYHFLGMSENSDLKALQEKAGQKKKELATTGKKDAVVTAGITLTGHCLTIFKSDEARLAYDISLARAKIAALDSDINIAAINKKIRHEYFDALIDKAVEYGMDRMEASSYIRSFCQKKKYGIEQKPEKKRLFVTAAAASALAVVIMVAGFFVFSKIHHKNVLKSDYQQLIKKVGAQTKPDQKIRLLKKYVNNHVKSEYSVDAKNRISQIELQINSKKLDQILKQADQLIEAEKLDDALAFYNRHLTQELHKESKKTVNQRIKNVLALIEKRDFKELTTVALKGEPDQKIEIFQKYLKTHSNGKNKDQVKSLINEMSVEYFIYVKKKLAFYEQHEKWEDCVRLCQSYIGIYDNSNSDQLKQQLPEYQENIRNKKIYISLVEKADKHGTNYDAASQVFKDYLEAYPESSITKKIKKDIKRLNDLMSIQNINQAANAIRLQFAETKGRFVEKHPGVIIDTKTGLMWSMLDSDITKPDTCLNYEEGKRYVESLTTGGFTDWRLPAPEELVGIFNTSPTFPVNGKKSYWTSENYSGYSDGWQIQVTTFSSEYSTRWEITQKNALECGVVRAVRSP